jgi:hypothetical protein
VIVATGGCVEVLFRRRFPAIIAFQVRDGSPMTEPLILEVFSDYI